MVAEVKDEGLQADQEIMKPFSAINSRLHRLIIHGYPVAMFPAMTAGV
jgi:hypothetical protein